MTPREEVRAHILSLTGQFSTRQIAGLKRWKSSAVCDSVEFLKLHGAIVKTRRAEGANAWYYRVVNPAFKPARRKFHPKIDECLEPWQFGPLLNCFPTREGRAWI